MSTKLLFVCSGNICRSPMALAIARHEAQQIGIEIEVDSAGTLMIDDHPADAHAVSVCKDIGVDLTQHLSKGLTHGIVDWADHILVMENHHATFIQAQFPAGRDKIIYMGHLVGQMGILDPIGRTRRTFKKNRDTIQQAVGALLSRLIPR